MKMRITEEEYIHLLHQAEYNQTITTSFDSKGVYLTDSSEQWVLKALHEFRSKDTK